MMMDYYNPYMARYQSLQAPEMFRGQITRVNGRNGAEAFRMAQNSSALLLDENDPTVYLLRLPRKSRLIKIEIMKGGGSLDCFDEKRKSTILIAATIKTVPPSISTRHSYKYFIISRRKSQAFSAKKA